MNFLPAIIRYVFSGILITVCSVTFSQQKADAPAWPGNPALDKQLTSSQPKTISNDIFSRGAVSYADLVQRAATHPYMPNEMIVAMEFPVAKKTVMPELKKINWEIIFGGNTSLIRTLSITQKAPNLSIALLHIKLPVTAEVFSAMKIANARPDVIWSSPNFYYPGDPRDVVPNDPSYGGQYHHNLMDNDLGWNATYGNALIKIGITDDGVDLPHVDLAANIWVNPGEIAGNGLDDDGNSYIDDVNGWDFTTNTNNPNPNSSADGHGTHVSGIAAARTNNGIGVAGVAGQCTIVPIQFYSSSTAWTAAIINAAYSYAADNGVKVLSTSYNIDGFVGDPVFTAGLQYMYDANVLHFNSAGNNNQLNPVRQSITHSLFVASTKEDDGKSSFSNYGTGIDISAPGSNILSTLLDDLYGLNSGTSMATPNAAGAAALIWSAFPSWTREQVAAQLLATADNIDAVNPAFVGLLGTGRVNTGTAISTTLPPPRVKTITGLPAEGATVGGNSITDIVLSFNQLLDPASANTIGNYQFRYAGPNGLFGDGDDVALVVTTTEVYRVGTNQQLFSLDNGPLACGNYRFSLLSGGLKNPFNTSLDGNSDGTAGDNFVRNFNVTGTYYADNDGDGVGAGSAVSVCPAPAGFVLTNGDCNDTNNAIYPGAVEICNSIDDNCDGIVDIWDLPLNPAQTFSNITPILIPGVGTGSAAGAPANIYPSVISVSGVAGPIGKIKVRLPQFSHTWPDDVDMLLVSPSGQKFILMSDAGDDADVVNVNLEFDDAAATLLPATLVAGTYKPTNLGLGDVFPAPAPAGPYFSPGSADTATMSSAFTGNANGNWSLYIVDDVNGDAGSMNGGWQLTIQALTPACGVVPLSLLSFQAVDESARTAILQWKTSAENNTSSFDVEESVDGFNFYKVGTVSAVGWGDNNYSLRVTLPSTLNYYRLKMNDRDSRFVQSGVVVVSRKIQGITIANNPVNDYLTLIASSSHDLKMFNSEGQLLKSFTTQPGRDRIDVRRYSSGVYYLRGDGVSLKFLISR